MNRALEKLEDFRLLPAYVGAAMLVGIGLGKAEGISNYRLTPPIEAIESIFQGNYDFNMGNSLALGVVAGLFLMIYPAMTNVRLEDLGKAFRSGRQLAVVVLMNFAVAPFVMFALAKMFLANDHELQTGLILYGIAPCIAMVIVFTHLARGNTPLALVFVAFNSIIQMLLIPLYAHLLLGDVRFSTLVVGKSVVLYLGLPLLLGFTTRRVGVTRLGEERFEGFRVYLNALAIVGLLLTLVVMFSLKGDLIVDQPTVVLEMAVPMAIFFAMMFFATYRLGAFLRFTYEDSVAVAFNSTGRDFEIAIAVAITAFSPTVALATVVGPLIEVPVMLSFVWAARRSRVRLFNVQGPAEKRIAAGNKLAGSMAESDLAERSLTERRAAEQADA